jgi:hypothetical protein
MAQAGEWRGATIVGTTIVGSSFGAGDRSYPSQQVSAYLNFGVCWRLSRRFIAVSSRAALPIILFLLLLLQFRLIFV